MTCGSEEAEIIASAQKCAGKEGFETTCGSEEAEIIASAQKCEEK